MRWLLLAGIMAFATPVHADSRVDQTCSDQPLGLCSLRKTGNIPGATVPVPGTIKSTQGTTT